MLWHCTQRQTKTLLVATLLVFSAYGFLLARDLRIARTYISEIPAQAVGAFAAVPPNEYNTLALQLAEREGALDAREAALARAERASTEQSNTTLVLIVIMGAGLLGLILLNFYLDHQRRRSLT